MLPWAEPSSSPICVAIETPFPSVSVVVAIENDRGFIRDCVDSLLEQDVPIEELIFLDTGSTDGTPALVSGVVGRHQGRAAPRHPWP